MILSNITVWDYLAVVLVAAVIVLAVKLILGFAVKIFNKHKK